MATKCIELALASNQIDFENIRIFFISFLKPTLKNRKEKIVIKHNHNVQKRKTIGQFFAFKFASSMETITNEIFYSLALVLEMIIIYLIHVLAEIQSLPFVVYPPSYSGLLCCTTKTENRKLELASMSPSTPSSGHSLHSIRPNVTG